MTRPVDAELYRMFDRSPIGMYRSTRDGHIRYANAALARILGYTLEELLTRNLNRDIYVDPGERARLIERYGEIGMIDGATVTWKHATGRILTIRLFGHIVHGEGAPSFDASVMDVTELEEANAELRRQRAELQRAATTLDMVVRQVSALWWIVDCDSRIQDVGGLIARLTTVPTHSLGMTFAEMLGPDHVSVGMHRRAIEGEAVSYNTEYQGLLLDVRIAPVRVGDVIVGAIGTSVDVTTTRMLERRMVDAQRAESLGVLAGGLAHDFNNLLVAIIGNADLGLRDTPAGAPGHAALDNIRNAGLRAAELTNQLLSYAGHGNVSRARVDLAPIVTELLRISAAHRPAEVAFDIEVARDLAVRGDAAQIRQVVHNLIANATDALRGRGGTVTIRARLERHDGTAHPDDALSPAAGTYVALQIDDDGEGMDADTRRRVFEPFFTTKPTGHGLGLAAVLGIVRGHGGGLRVSSTPGNGASFQVLWPATTTPVEMPAVLPAARTVLIVDDEDLVRDVVARMIEDLGYAAITSADGPSALALLEHTTVDAVLVDLTMPVMSGADVIAALRAQRPQLPIVLCSGFDRDRRGPVKADAYLPKPFRIETLELTLAKLLS